MRVVLKVLTVFGTRPEAIKLGPVIQELGKHPDRVMWKVCVTAQHRQILDQVLRLFQIEPNYDPNIMQDDQSLSYVTARVLTELEGVIQREKPDWVVVQGDTTTTMAASLAAYYQRVKVAHVEAGLRTGDKHRPYPEGMNRVIADHLADLHFAPTERARQNLLREGIPEERILVTGNTVIDALLWAAAQAPPPEVLALFRQLGIAHEAGEQGSRGAEEQGNRGYFSPAPMHPGSPAQEAPQHLRPSAPCDLPPAGELRGAFRGHLPGVGGDRPALPRCAPGLPGAPESPRAGAGPPLAGGAAQHLPHPAPGLPALRASDEAGVSDPDRFRRHPGGGAQPGGAGAGAARGHRAPGSSGGRDGPPGRG